MRNKTRKSCLIIGGVGAVVSVAILLCAITLFTDLCGVNDKSAIETAREWAGLAPLPATASNLYVETTGNMFTHGFDITFTAPIKDIDKWLASSPGIANVEPTREGNIRIYKIKPRSGAAFAEVKVDESKEQVSIRTYWS